MPEVHKFNCPYNKPGVGVCVNPNCYRPFVLCEQGYSGQICCRNFHERCSKLRWDQVENLIYNNPNLKAADYMYLQQKMDAMFLAIIAKVQQEHSKFKMWVKSYGHSMEVMQFIRTVSEQNFNTITGASFAPLWAEMCSPRKVETPRMIQSQIITLQQQLLESIQRISDLYLKPGQKREQSLTTSPLSISPVLLQSKITNDFASIQRLFDSKISSCQLLFRASQNNYSIKQFHKKCDGATNTLTLIETQYGKVIGGFTPISWSSAKKQWAADKSLKSFIFSLNLRQKFNLNLAQFAIANNPEKGPIFGCCDICLVDSSNRDKSNAQFPISYNNGKYIRSPQSSFAFTGHPKGQFLTKQWQVFRIQLD